MGLSRFNDLASAICLAEAGLSSSNSSHGSPCGCYLILVMRRISHWIEDGSRLPSEVVDRQLSV